LKFICTAATHIIHKYQEFNMYGNFNLTMIFNHKNTPAKSISAVCLGLSFFILAVPAAIAETFSIGGFSLNTNAQFRLKDGHPVMFTWALNSSDNDQQFDRQAANLLKHRSTGKCLNAYQPAIGSEVNVYPCNATDGDQKFSFVAAGTNINLIQRMGTNLCLSMTTQSANIPIVLQTCNSSDPKQKFTSNASTVLSPGTAQAKINAFVQQFEGTPNIQRYDTQAYPGQCVTLIARYLQEHYGASRTSLTLGNGKDTAGVVANQFSQSFAAISAPGDPVPGSIMSFPSLAAPYGHVAIVINSTRVGNTLNVTILESNGNNLAGTAQGTSVTRRSITINATNFVSPTYGNSIYWTNPKN
jgi:surface antigen